MNREEILREYKNQDDKLLLAKVLDKIEFMNKRNKIEYTDFLDMYQQQLVEKFLAKNQFNNYLFFGGFENSERNIIIVYPEKYNEEMIRKNYHNIMKIIKITLPNDMVGKYNHKDYLGGVIKLGIERKKVGDIVTDQNGADIVVMNEISEFLFQNLSSLIRFSESEILLDEIENIREVNIQKEEYNIIVSSMRLDNVVSELAKCSRNKANEIIATERVFINGQNELKTTKQVKVSDMITIRGKGRFTVKDLVGSTRSGRNILKIEKFK